MLGGIVSVSLCRCLPVCSLLPGRPGLMLHLLLCTCMSFCKNSHVLLSVQVPFVFAACFLAGRALFCILSNLTTNELYNRHRYLYLNNEAMGYSNRWGVLLVHSHTQLFFSYGEEDKMKCFCFSSSVFPAPLVQVGLRRL